MKQNQYEIIVLDLDGTLTNRDKVITPRTKKALMEAQARGKKVVLASGRPTQGVMPLAEELDLPVIVHEREAHEDGLRIVEEFPEVTGVFHCYSGSLEMAKELLKRGFYLGFGGTSTYKNAAKVREVLQYVPDDLLLFETDSPYLTPVPYRGKRNQPGYTELVARNAAEVRGTTFEALAVQTTKNVKTLFNKIK